MIMTGKLLTNLLTNLFYCNLYLKNFYHIYILYKYNDGTKTRKSYKIKT